MKIYNLKNNYKPLVSIIILTRNGLHYTKLCIDSILRNTKVSYELIFIDNYSHDGTVSYLKTVKNSRLIVNKVNNGFSKGCNQGIKIASGEFLVLLNNDTIVSKDWLPRMIWWLENNPSIGIVGPRSNMVMKEQSIHPISYNPNSIEEIEQFAEIWAVHNNRTGYKVSLLSGFCMVFQKELVDTIGGFDEQFYPGNAEDIDFGIRARLTGKKLWVANDVFIHHYGNSSFKENNENYKHLLIENSKKLSRKWNFRKLDEIENLIKREEPFDHPKHYIPL